MVRTANGLVLSLSSYPRGPFTQVAVSMSSPRQHRPETETLSIDQDALTLAKRVQKPGQTKEQLKQISQGIAKGIELYKRQQSAKARERDKTRKKWLKEKTLNAEAAQTQSLSEDHDRRVYRGGWLLVALGCINLIWYLLPAEFQGLLPGIMSGCAITAGLIINRCSGQ
jgi:hypothetical protein